MLAYRFMNRKPQVVWEGVLNGPRKSLFDKCLARYIPEYAMLSETEGR